MDDAAVANWVRVIEEKDLSTAAHTWRVVLYARAMAESAALPSALIERITRGAALHDLGKLDVPTAILQKPAKLTEAEFAIIKTHAAAGHSRLLALGERDELVLGMVRHHHERMDGTGYPDGLRAEAIPLAARYFAVIDAFDAMTSIRPYRNAVGLKAAEAALEELVRHGPGAAGSNTTGSAAAGEYYCGESIDLLERLLRSDQLTWILGHFNDATALPGFGTASVIRR